MVKLPVRTRVVPAVLRRALITPAAAFAMVIVAVFGASGPAHAAATVHIHWTGNWNNHDQRLGRTATCVAWTFRSNHTVKDGDCATASGNAYWDRPIANNVVDNLDMYGQRNTTRSANGCPTTRRTYVKCYWIWSDNVVVSVQEDSSGSTDGDYTANWDYIR